MYAIEDDRADPSGPGLAEFIRCSLDPVNEILRIDQCLRCVCAVKAVYHPPPPSAPSHGSALMETTSLNNDDDDDDDILQMMPFELPSIAVKSVGQPQPDLTSPASDQVQCQSTHRSSTSNIPHSIKSVGQRQSGTTQHKDDDGTDSTDEADSSRLYERRLFSRYGSRESPQLLMH